MGKQQKNTSSLGHYKLPPSKLSELQQGFKKKLEGARFRSINEALYTRPGGESFLEFQEDPKLFDVYHQVGSAIRAYLPLATCDITTSPSSRARASARWLQSGPRTPCTA